MEIKEVTEEVVEVEPIVIISKKPGRPTGYKKPVKKTTRKTTK